MRKVWNVLVVCFILFCTVAVPLEIGFERGMRMQMGVEGWRAWEQFNLIVDIFFMVDVALNFRCVQRIHRVGFQPFSLCCLLWFCRVLLPLAAHAARIAHTAHL